MIIASRLFPALVLALTLSIPSALFAEAKEPPFFQIDRTQKGPLTMAELQVNLPQEVAKDLSDREQQCFYERVELLIADAGDPRTPDWSVFPNHGEIDDWDKLQPRAQRAILAQVTMGEAMFLCLGGY